MAKSSNFDRNASSHPIPPLAGQTILVTRAEHQADSLQQKLEKLGAKVVLHPVIRIEAPSESTQLDQAIAELTRFDWLLFTSTNAVRFFVRRMIALTGSVDAIQDIQVAAVGTATATEFLANCGRGPDFIPSNANGETLGLELAKMAQGQTLLIPRASRSSPQLADVLTRATIAFESPLTYVSTDVTVADPKVAAQLAAGQIDWMTITSPALARAAAGIFGDDLRKTKLACISSGTSSAISELGYSTAAEAVEFNMTGVINAIIEWLRNHQ